MENVEIQTVEARRSFLKKVAYAAPAIVALGALTAPMSVQASVVFSQKTIKNNAGNTANVSEHYDNVGKFTQDGTFTPTGGTTTVYDRVKIVEAPKNWLQNFFDSVFGRA